MTPYVIDVTPKSLRETLCIAQSAIRARPYDQHRKPGDIAVLQELIDECDRLRPLLPDGKHDGPSERCTDYCGCEAR